MFSARLKKLRTDNGYTQQSMADKIEISLNAYQKYEHGDRMPPYETVVKLADIFNVSLDYLFCRDDFIKSHGVSVGEP